MFPQPGSPSSLSKTSRAAASSPRIQRIGTSGSTPPLAIRYSAMRTGSGPESSTSVQSRTLWRTRGSDAIHRPSLSMPVSSLDS
jgi:hypothetical protein